MSLEISFYYVNPGTGCWQQVYDVTSGEFLRSRNQKGRGEFGFLTLGTAYDQPPNTDIGYLFAQTGHHFRAGTAMFVRSYNDDRAGQPPSGVEIKFPQGQAPRDLASVNDLLEKLTNALKAQIVDEKGYVIADPDCLKILGDHVKEITQIETIPMDPIQLGWDSNPYFRHRYNHGYMLEKRTGESSQEYQAGLKAHATQIGNSFLEGKRPYGTTSGTEQAVSCLTVEQASLLLNRPTNNQGDLYPIARKEPATSRELDAGHSETKTIITEASPPIAAPKAEFQPAANEVLTPADAFAAQIRFGLEQLGMMAKEVGPNGESARRTLGQLRADFNAPSKTV